MAIPPFPSQDLAKLVLGYLAEEQLMTAYDEFLQASPYLDALRNEYDRIFMTSLKNILAEYRAVKIFVETCKPLILRKKLVQCSNLLEVVKILLNHVDIGKLQSQDVTTDKLSLMKQNTPISTKQDGCDVCSSLNLVSCACKSRLSNPSVHTSNHVQTSTLESSVETTALEDLPGNHVTSRKKHVRVLEKETFLLDSNVSHNLSSQKSPVITNSDSAKSLSNSSNTNVSVMKSNDVLPIFGLNSIVKAPNPECSEKIEEFNNIFNKVCKEISSVDSGVHVTGSVENRISNATTFQDFASGVCGHENRNVPVPDSSTSESSNIPKTCSFSTSNSKEILQNESAIIKTSNLTRIKPKPKPIEQQQKIKILSDVKVDNLYNTNNNATSTPLMQTIVINGTPAYKPNMPHNNYTKDEIMAMPTIIVVPASGVTKSGTQTKFGGPQKLNPVTKTFSSTRRLGPLMIDVSSGPGGNETVLSLQQAIPDAGLVKTVEATKNATVPKDNTVTCAAESNTPQVLPPVRKSSSTPRRNSHIRVLDFATPRRILQDTINEQASSQTSDEPVEIVHSKSPSVTFTNTDKVENKIVDMNIVKVQGIESSSINITCTQDHIKSKRSNWDADLRALVTANESHSKPFVKIKAKSRSKKKVTESDKQQEKDIDGADAKKSRTKKKIVSPKSKKPKRSRILYEEENDNSVNIVEGSVNVTVKPTIKIIPADKYENSEINKGNDSNNHNKYKTDEANETPEAERIALQNAIGAKLNISDLLETPYKQALYDIQMETPKFLGPDLPGEPISDIKIMNIPTPRFFDTPKPAQATPSSYSSRPTDYSSGGSYYKPDDQDYLPIPDLECPVSSSKPVLCIDLPVDKDNDSKKSRPVRKCTKNVSYFNSTTVNNKTKDKDSDDKIEIASSCSDSTVTNYEKKEVNTKTPKNNKPKTQAKSETKKKVVGSSKKLKSPIKKPNTFMKIKPRRPTPTKESYSGKYNRKSDTNSKTQMKKKTNGKEKNIHMTPIITCVPTKSRRKSSTPRKLHCSKIFNSESSGHDSPDINATNVKENIAPDKKIGKQQKTRHDSDTDQLALRWSDDGSQDLKHKEKPLNSEIEDISKIKEYIETTAHNKPNYIDVKCALHVDLIKRGFDAETAKIIERDLLDTPPHTEHQNAPCHMEIIETKKDDTSNKSIATDVSSANDLHIVQDTEDVEVDEIELSIHECNEDSKNYVNACHDDTKDIPRGHAIKLKDKFSMEVCIDDGVTIRLRANDLTFLFDHGSSNVELGYNFRETEIAVSSISNIDKLYTPLKDQMKATCYEIFDSTLTSLDTPLKPNSPKPKQYVVPEVEVVVEEEKLDSKERNETRKRKRLQNSKSPEQNDNDQKKTKSEAQYLLNSTNIQNIDIESVLKKLHGP